MTGDKRAVPIPAGGSIAPSLLFFDPKAQAAAGTATASADPTASVQSPGAAELDDRIEVDSVCPYHSSFRGDANIFLLALGCQLGIFRQVGYPA
jgi:hypothetical protein